jgi:hypothetical protein
VHVYKEALRELTMLYMGVGCVRIVDTVLPGFVAVSKAS